MSGSKSICVGLIGFGYAGRTFHAPLVRSVSGLELTAVDPGRATQYVVNLAI